MQTLFEKFDRRGPAEQAQTSSAIMTREQVVDRIISENPSATREYLDRFNRDELHIYMKRLEFAHAPRGRGPGWVRTGSDPAMCSSAAA